MIFETALINAFKRIDFPKRCTIILSDRNGVEPSAPYMMINIIDQANIARSRKTINNTKDNQTEGIFQVKELDVSLTLHALATDDMHDWFERFQVISESDFVQWAFTQEGLSLVDIKDIVYQNISVNNKTYKRAILDLTIRSERYEEVVVNTVKRLSIQGNLTNKYDDVDIGEEKDWNFDSSFPILWDDFSVATEEYTSTPFQMEIDFKVED